MGIGGDCRMQYEIIERTSDFKQQNGSTYITVRINA